MLSFLGITTVSSLHVSPGRRFCLHFTYIPYVYLAYPLHTCTFSNRHHPGIISMIVALPDFLMVVPCSLGHRIWCLCTPTVKTIWNRKTKMVLLFTAPQVEASEVGLGSRRKVVEGKWKYHYFFLRWLQMQVWYRASVSSVWSMLSVGWVMGRCWKMASAPRWPLSLASGYLKTSSSDNNSWMSLVSYLLTSQKCVDLFYKIKKIVISTLHASQGCC